MALVKKIQVPTSSGNAEYEIAPFHTLTINDTIYDGSTDVEITVGGGGTSTGDMLKSVYATNGATGTVDKAVNSTQLNGQAASYYAVAADLDDKVDKVTGKDLSTNDYTDADKNIVDDAMIKTNYASSTAGVVKQADKVTYSMTIKGIGTSDIVFDGSSAVTIEFDKWTGGTY